MTATTASGAAEGRRLHGEVRRFAIAPEVSSIPQSGCRIGDVATLDAVVHSDPEILGGTPVFRGTRVPLKNLVDYLAAGDTLDQFLDDFPTVRREQAIAALELARDLLIAGAHPSR